MLRQIKLGIVLRLFQLLALTVELLSQIFLLLSSHALRVKLRGKKTCRALILLLQRQVFGVLQSASDFHVQLLDGIALLKHFRRRKLSSFGDLSNFGVFETDDHVLWLEVRVDDLAHAMHIV